MPSAWLYNFCFKRSLLSWLPYAVSFGAAARRSSRTAAWGGGMHGGPPTVAMTVLAALLGIGIHFLNALPDLVEDNEDGLRHLPLRIALRIGAPRLLWSRVGWTAVVGAVVHRRPDRRPAPVADRLRRPTDAAALQASHREDPSP